MIPEGESLAAQRSFRRRGARGLRNEVSHA